MLSFNIEARGSLAQQSALRQGSPPTLIIELCMYFVLAEQAYLVAAGARQPLLFGIVEFGDA